ncbi:hypothetical protein ACIBF6_32495 [Streptosporangium amethystogenes]|uniref:protein kinase domain-containing protein n=1 Tax=Streptosporangium amethystogenes TaxID=2002 RepID=UPI0037BE1C71
MEPVRGRSLADLLRAEGPLPPARVVHIGSQMVSALRAAYQAGITHRDVEPANVLLEGERVVLTDFGITAVSVPSHRSPKSVPRRAGEPPSSRTAASSRSSHTAGPSSPTHGCSSPRMVGFSLRSRSADSRDGPGVFSG